VADPEQIYSEVLAEEQAKGSASPVAEGRAKAARARAEHGSPHPKEAKWWPGAQPHLEGGGGGEAEVEPVEEAAQDEPAEAPVAEETPAATEEVQAPQEPQEQTAPPPEAQPAAATASVPTETTAAPVAAAEATPEAKPSGVIHGTTTGTRLRPEDESTTEAQFQGQADMYDRRKLIDELIATGVPAVSAHDTGEKRSPALALMYLLIPILAIAFLLAQNDSAPATAEGPGGGGGADKGITVVAQGVAFDTDNLALTAGKESPITFSNEDTVEHNIAIYEDEAATKNLFKGEIVPPGGTGEYSVPALDKGEYYFHCDIHPSMSGSVTVE
jgi:plastocyanin